jgi:hypothetical protein
MTGIALKMALVVTVPVIVGMIIRGLAENFISSKINIINKITRLVIYNCLCCYLD